MPSEMIMNDMTTTQTTWETGISMPVPARPGNFALDRWEILQLVKDTARSTGIREREIAVLAAHLSVLTPGPVQADQVLVSYAQVARILPRANCMDERRFRRGEARLEELGFVTRKLSANARRYPVRDGSGKIVDAYGIDLRPLFLRAEELAKCRTVQVSTDRAREAHRSRLSAMLSDLKRRCLQVLGDVPTNFVNTARKLRNLLRRNTLDSESIASIESAIREAECVFMSASTETNIHESQVKLSADVGQTVRHIESNKKIIKEDQPVKVTRMSMDHLWLNLPNLSTFFPNQPRSENQLMSIIFEFLSFLGLRQETRNTVVRVLGSVGAAQLSDYLSKHINEIKSIEHYVRKLLAEHKAGKCIAAGSINGLYNV